MVCICGSNDTENIVTDVERKFGVVPIHSTMLAAQRSSLHPNIQKLHWNEI